MTTKREMDMLRHAVSDNDGTRNVWGGRTAECAPLIAAGLLERTGEAFGMEYFQVTEAGIAAVDAAVAAERKRKRLRYYEVTLDGESGFTTWARSR